MLRSTVLTNRLTWINFLRNPTRKKAVATLDKGHGARCCLGHGCYILRLPRSPACDPNDEGHTAYRYDGEGAIAPALFMDKVGLWTSEGGSRDGFFDTDFVDASGEICEEELPIDSLVQFNDNTEATPYDIGDYLYEVLDGGPNTPWKALKDYPDA